MLTCYLGLIQNDEKGGKINLSNVVENKQAASCYATGQGSMKQKWPCLLAKGQAITRQVKGLVIAVAIAQNHTCIYNFFSIILRKKQ